MALCVTLGMRTAGLVGFPCTGWCGLWSMGRILFPSASGTSMGTRWTTGWRTWLPVCLRWVAGRRFGRTVCRLVWHLAGHWGGTRPRSSFLGRAGIWGRLILRRMRVRPMSWLAGRWRRIPGRLQAGRRWRFPTWWFCGARGAGSRIPEERRLCGCGIWGCQSGRLRSRSRRVTKPFGPCLPSWV